MHTLGEEFFEVAVDDFLLRIDLVVLAKGGVEGLNLGERNLVKLDNLITLARRIEDVVVDVLARRTDTIDTTDALHQLG